MFLEIEVLVSGFMQLRTWQAARGNRYSNHIGLDYPDIGPNYFDFGQTYPKVGSAYPEAGLPYADFDLGYPDIGLDYPAIGSLQCDRSCYVPASCTIMVPP